jgi:hypothetical protein
MHNCAFAATHEARGGHEDRSSADPPLLAELLLGLQRKAFPVDSNALSFSFFPLNPLSSTLKHLVDM